MDQVFATQPVAFKEKHPTTYSIIDANEVFMETPTNLFMQSSTWSKYKQYCKGPHWLHTKWCYLVYPLYIYGISGIELTRVSGFLDTSWEERGLCNG